MLFENFIFMYLLRVMIYKIWNFLSKIEEQNFIDSENECNTKTDPNTLRLFHYGKCLRVPLGHSLIIHLKKVFIGKKKVINILTAVFIFHKSGIKIFLKWIINECPKDTR